MSLDRTRLENVRFRGGKLIARCPACAESGADRSGDHLAVFESGAYHCLLYPKGDPHQRRIWDLLGTLSPGAHPAPVRPPARKIAIKPRPSIPALRPLSITEMSQIAHQRNWTYFAGLQLLANRGLVWQGEVYDAGSTWPAWIITDQSRRNAQARRLDAQRWAGIGNKKAKTIPYSDPSWPIGAAEIRDHQCVLLCEGQPDFAAALLVAWWFDVAVAPVCITGAGNSIHIEALPLFAGKHVRIATHDDEEGRNAGAKWAKQLYGAGAAKVDRFDFNGMSRADGRPVNDLADYATLLGTELPQPENVLEGMDAFLASRGGDNP